MMVKRRLVEVVCGGFRPGFVNVIYGPRRVGKTVLIDQIVSSLPEKSGVLMFNGDTQETRDTLSTTSETRLVELVENRKVLIVDEAQRIKNIGLSLKILTDKFPDLKIIVTGSSTLDLSKGVRETLTGRAVTYHLYPLSIREITPQNDFSKAKYLLPDLLIYGGYPYLRSLGTAVEKRQYLETLVGDYLLKDLLELKEVGDPDVPRKLLSLLAHQLGNQVSINELAAQLSISAKTVIRYLGLLGKIFVIFPMGTYSTNLRKEVTRSKKYYFYDLGIRNAVIRQFGTLDSRTDVGALWENFLVLERLKKHEYNRESVDTFFWRDYAQNEVDLVEKTGQTVEAYEFKWGTKKLAKTPKFFRDSYKINTQTINPDNFGEFV